MKIMKKFHYKSGALLLITLLTASVTLSAEEVTKEFHKEYTPGPGTTLEISNRYGDVAIASWDKNQIVIDVKVTVELPSRERAEKLISYIDVQFTENENLIMARTVIDDKFSFSGWGGDSKKFRIDYNIKMPAGTTLTLSNRYGNTKINELSGLVNLDIKYGNLTAGKLTRGNEKPWNSLKLAYGKGTIDETGWMTVNIRYTGNLEIKKSTALLLDSKYSKLSLGETSSVVGESKYDNIRIGSIKNLDLDNGYSDVNIGSLATKLRYEGSYGSFSIESIPAEFESIDVATRYMGVKLGIADNASYELNGHVRYGGLKYNEDNFKFNRRIIENNSTEIAGVVGKEESPSAKVRVVASYGTVRLY
ncbi:MAG: hypothetical protein A2X05_18540 [Bacteroidetes bacterium GWE2_41_25]|nr:MAG: hypothetical protein A2X03_16645 [Bacteroidetes bacterium GWA2_40_15]OFX96654.1 MAG: hypothetical protein A2X05_18540 [Bacteroidetes bacterium GWE2_41_25]OFX97726.1 MAG: hypothetical protein A2X06_13335 [Bacteroidetes bacterium GWC2_40_22]OFY58415.1 MAG: hypothetical protein A2X04_06755 [Bacteroidetes bacterium GWF2_41_9]HAM10141.1 hypothetical protein [Bacteroidales bacterium]